MECIMCDNYDFSRFLLQKSLVLVVMECIMSDSDSMDYDFSRFLLQRGLVVMECTVICIIV